jgi:hypothetical protein
MMKLLLTGVAALFLATGAAMAEPPDLEGPVHHPHSYSRDEIGRCSLPHTPSDERLEEHEQCCKRWFPIATGIGHEPCKQFGAIN